MSETIKTIKNECLTVQVNTFGAQMWSVKDKENTEYLWQGDPKYWEDRSPLLFPYIARLTEGTYRLNGQEYKMDIHGFAKDSQFEIAKHTENELVLRLTDSPGTYEQYPYHFVLEVGYELSENQLKVTYHVENKDTKTMYYGVGGHPGFCVPLQEDEKFEDYYLEFSGEGHARKELFSEDCFVLERTEDFLLKDGNKLPLTHDLFDNDAIILSSMPKCVTLKSLTGNKAVQVTYGDMDYLGLWHWPKTDAPYLCIEPWSSLPSRKGVVEDFEKQENLKQLEAGCAKNHCWEIEIYKTLVL